MKRYVSVRTLAARYEVNASTVWRWTKSGRLPAPKQMSGKCTRWDLDEIEACERDKTRAVA